MIEGPKIVRCRWCPSARCAEHDLRRERKSRRRRRHFDAAVAGAAVGTTETARASLACSSHRSSRLVSVVYRHGSLVRGALPVSRVCGSGFDVAHLSREFVRVLVPRAAVLARPLQHLEVAALRRAPHARRPTSHGQSFSRAHFSTSRWPRSAAHRAHVSSSHGQPFARAHFSTSRWPPLTATCARPSSTRLPRAHEPSARRARRAAPRAPTSAPRGGRPPPPTRTSLVPRAVVLARPLQHLEVAALRRRLARLLVPRAVVLARPLQHLEVASPRASRARLLVPRAVVLARPLQRLEVAARRRGAHVHSSHGQSFRAPTSAPRGPPTPQPPRARLQRPRWRVGNSPRGAKFLNPNASRSPTLAAAAHRRRSSDSRPRRRRHLSVLTLRAPRHPLPRTPPPSARSRPPRRACLCSPREAPRGPRGREGVFPKKDGDIEGQGRKSDARLRVEVPLSLARARLDAACRRFRRPSLGLGLGLA